MQFTSSFFALLTAALTAAPALAQQAILNYDNQYDNRNGPLSGTACAIPGHPTFGSFPTWPFITGSFLVTEFNDVDCGTCYNLTFNRDGTQVTRTFTIINSAPIGPPGSFVASWPAVEELTGYTRNTFPGSVDISYQRVPNAQCGL